ncbi:T9SS type A sorting domain-containing protein [Methanococcoides sp. SA1]|nr:T9SS type A sorting domain-containing protein [Methanococcoides sp. SA1]
MKKMKYIIAAIAIVLNLLQAQNLVINEIQSSNRNTIQDKDGDYSDWFELYNNDTKDINLSGFGITDDTNDPYQWIFPDIKIHPKEHLLIFASGKNITDVYKHYETIIREGDEWKYRVNTSEVNGNWRVSGFDDSSWETGPSGIGYGDNDDATIIQEGIISIYARKAFTIDSLDEIISILFHIDFDDGYVAYINGKEVIRAFVDGDFPGYDQVATTVMEPKMINGEIPDEIRIQNIKDYLVEGENILAIQVHNISQSSSDLTCIPFLTLYMNNKPENARGAVDFIGVKNTELHTNFSINSSGDTLILVNQNGDILENLVVGEIPKNLSWGRKPDGSENWVLFEDVTPGDENSTRAIIGIADKPEFSAVRGIYHENFELIITSSDNANIYYTLDGSDPRTNPLTFVKESPAIIDVNPETTIGNRGHKPGFIVRAVAGGDEFGMSDVVTHTYLFTDRVKDLSPDGQSPGPGWATVGWGSGHEMDYGMDSEVLNDNEYSNKIDDALIDIPSINITTELSNLFDANDGIYINSEKHGKEWERPASIELLNPDGSEGFQIDCGIRIRGGWSRHNNNPKHAFRLFFRNEYGKSKLEFPLFGDEGVDEFDKVDLRTSQNYSWSFGGDPLNIMNREVFSRDVQREMGQPYTRSRYYHLYINGVYWGLYQTQERTEARFAESYLGGDSDDYDVVKVDVGEFYHLYNIEVTDGNLDLWEEVWGYCQSPSFTNSNYFKLQGKTREGIPNPNYRNLVDIENLIEYMLIIFYGGNYDAPVSKFSGNINPNNFIAIINREENEGFRFFVHDAEHTLLIDPVNVGDGLYENRVNIGDVENRRMIVSRFEKFHPQWLHYKLTLNDEYRINFADHVYKHMFNNGILTPANTTQLFQSRADEIEMAIIAESARWGDSKTNSPFTKATWENAINNVITKYFPFRTNIVINQLKDSGLYPNINPPLYRGSGTITDESIIVDSGYELQIKNENGTGTIYYTLDGIDPRKIGGYISPNAQSGETEVNLTINTTTVIKSRIKTDDEWSALHELTIIVNDDFSNLRVTEIHYHPLDNDTIDDGEYEFLELKNVGDYSLNLTSSKFVDGVEYTFPANAVLNPGEFYVIASNEMEFQNRYGFEPNSNYGGQLRNSGEKVAMVSASGDTILKIEYNDKDPWPEDADGGGYSLVPVNENPETNSSVAEDWKRSTNIHGSPNANDGEETAISDEKSKFPDKFELYQNYPNPFNPTTTINYLNPDDSNVIVQIFDIQGKLIKTLINEYQFKGYQKVVWNAKNENGISVTNGIYFYRVSIDKGNISDTGKMLLLK